jgi:26S proteasome regulatory subunit T3
MTDIEMKGPESPSKLVQKQVEEDLYMKMKEMESELQMYSIQENYLRDELRHLQSESIRSKEEVSEQLRDLTNFLLIRSREFSP